MFAEDANKTLWTSGGGQVVGWLNTKMFDETHDEAKSQGWTALILDTNGNGKRDAYVEPNQPIDPTKDKRYGNAFYAVAPAPDGSIWGSVLGFPGAIVRLNPGVEPAGDGAGGGVRAAVQQSEGAGSRVLTARRRRRSQRRRTGPRWRAATWRASIVASARARSTGRRRPDSIAPRAGRSTRSRCRNSRA